MGKDILSYYKEELGWNPPFAQILGKYVPEGLEGYLKIREGINEGSLDKKTRELIFTILDSLDNELEGAKAHARAAVDNGLTPKELTEAFMIVTVVKGINTLCKTGVHVIEAAEEREKENKSKE